MADLTVIATEIQNNASSIFKDPEERKRFYKYAMSIYANNNKLIELNKQQINGGILQMFLRDADPTAGEAYIIAYKSKYGTVAQVQNGYKYAEKKLWQTGEFKNKPITFELKEDEIRSFKPETRDIEYEVKPIKSFEEQKTRKDKKTVAYVSRFELQNGEIVEKLFWIEELEEHLIKYSQGYQQYKKDLKAGKPKGIWHTNKSDMLRKTAFMRAYTLYLPKTSKIKDAIKDINALNNATYTEVSQEAKPIYYDNPQGEVKAIEVKQEELPIELQHAAGTEYGKIFSFQKTLPKEEQKDYMSDVLDYNKQIKKENNFLYNKWQDVPWKALVLIVEYINEKYNANIELDLPYEKEETKTDTNVVFNDETGEVING